MNELTFVIVNARDSLSQLMIDELKSRVSFPVYQDNVDEDIWNLLRGGKDDMYIYDRCGRLTFYIPFPLSIIHPQQPIVSASIHAAYYEKICGDSCMLAELDSILPSDYEQSLDHNHIGENITDTLDVEDIKKVLNEENNLHANDSTIAVDDVGDEFSFLFNLNNSTATDNETIQNTTSDLDMFNKTVIFLDFINDTLVDTVYDNITEFPDNMTEFTDVNVTSVLNTTDFPQNATGKVKAIDEKERSFWDKMYNNIFSSNKTSAQKSHVTTPEDYQNNIEVTGKGRCYDPSHKQMCVEWTKKKLRHAYLCCNSDHIIHHIHGRGRCGHFHTKKCKKLQPILKCCLGTAFAPTESSYQRTTSQEHFATVG